MTYAQKDVFLSGEGDAWFRRNQEVLRARKHDPILDTLTALNLHPARVLEIGCANGWRLERLRQYCGAECHGIDPSAEAIDEGVRLFPALHLSVNDAANVTAPRGAYDMVLFGFSLYLCDREDLFQITARADAALVDGGHMVIYDFYAPTSYRNPYAHKAGVFAYKMDYKQLFLWHPAYSCLHESFYNPCGQAQKGYVADETVSLALLKKCAADAHKPNPYQKPNE